MFFQIVMMAGVLITPHQQVQAQHCQVAGGSLYFTATDRCLLVDNERLITDEYLPSAVRFDGNSDEDDVVVIEGKDIETLHNGITN